MATALSVLSAGVITLLLTMVVADSPFNTVSMLQTSRPSKKVQLGPSIFVDGMTEASARLRQIKKGYSAEYVFSYPVEPNGIRVNSTHVMIPLVKRLQATYIRYLRDLRHKDIGVANQKFFPQQGGLFSNKITVGLSEKLFAFSQLGKVAKSDLRKASQKAKAVMNATLPINSTQRNSLTTLTGLVSMGGLQMIYASGLPDPRLIQEVESSSRPSKRSLRAMVKWHRKMKRFFGKKINRDLGPQFSFVGCTHWENVPFDMSNMMVAFPLNKVLSTYRGTSASAPWTATDYFQGASHWRYFKKLKRVAFTFSASIHSHWPDPEGFDRDPPSVFYGSHDGSREPGPVPNAINPIPKSPQAYQFSLAAKSFAQDYSYLYQDRSTLCPQSKIDQIKKVLPTLQSLMVGLMKRDPAAFPPFATYVSDLLPCAIPFIKPEGNNCSAYGIYEANVLIHAAMEVPPSMQLAVVGANDWSDIDVNLLPFSRRRPKHEHLRELHAHTSS